MVKNQSEPDKKPPSRMLRPLPVHIALANKICAAMNLRGEDGRTLAAEMVRGIKIYQDHPFQRNMPPLREIWQAGTVKLYYCAPPQKPLATILLVPSLINRAHILDLLPDKSFTRFLAGQGMAVYLLDWGKPVDDPAMAEMDDLLSLRLLPALAAAKTHAVGPFYAAGYCMGGTLLAAAAVCAPKDLLDGAAFLASPWDFHAGDLALATQIQAGTIQALQMIETHGYLPLEWIQAVFAAVNEERTLHKFARFAQMAPDDPAAELFVAVEDWLNDGLDMPAGMARHCIKRWYGENAPGRGTWHGGGKLIDPAQVAARSLVMVPRRDRLVPAESALALASSLPDVTIMRPDCGHVGMMSGRNAENEVWAPLVDWVLQVKT